MRVVEKVPPVAAVLAALSALACCLPFGLVAAAGLAGFSLWAARYRLVFSGLAFIFLALGFLQMYRGRKSCRVRSRASVALLWVAVALVLLIFLFPQLIAAALARWS